MFPHHAPFLSKALAILLIAFGAQTASFAQMPDLTRYGEALAELTAYADKPGMRKEVKVSETSSGTHWAVGKENYTYTLGTGKYEVFAYKPLFQSGNEFIISVYADPKGTSEYFYLLRVQITDDTVKLDEVIDGGDRCQQGVRINDVSIANDTLTFSSYVTPRQIINWYSSEINTHELPNCMDCCCGYATFTYDLKGHQKELKNVLILRNHLPEDEIFLKCFKEFSQDRGLEHGLVLSPEELKKFIARIMAEK